MCRLRLYYYIPSLLSRSAIYFSSMEIATFRNIADFVSKLIIFNFFPIKFSYLDFWFNFAGNG